MEMWIKSFCEIINKSFYIRSTCTLQNTELSVIKYHWYSSSLTFEIHVHVFIIRSYSPCLVIVSWLVPFLSFHWLVSSASWFSFATTSQSARKILHLWKPVHSLGRSCHAPPWVHPPVPTLPASSRRTSTVYGLPSL